MTRPRLPDFFTEFMRWFPDEMACLDCPVRSRWPDGFVCPHEGDEIEDGEGGAA